MLAIRDDRKLFVRLEWGDLHICGERRLCFGNDRRYFHCVLFGAVPLTAIVLRGGMVPVPLPIGGTTGALGAGTGSGAPDC